jgi:hypothetical protein
VLHYCAKQLTFTRISFVLVLGHRSQLPSFSLVAPTLKRAEPNDLTAIETTAQLCVDTRSTNGTLGRRDDAIALWAKPARVLRIPKTLMANSALAESFVAVRVNVSGQFTLAFDHLASIDAYQSSAVRTQRPKDRFLKLER